MRVLIVRHGATRGNERKAYVGKQSDEPLSERGVCQCRRLGADGSVRTVYASPLLRAVQTAQLCFPQATIVLANGLEEMDFGAFEGKSAQDMEHDAAYRAWVETGCLARCPGGESYEDFRARTRAAMAKLLSASMARGDERVVVVAHGGTVMAALDGPFQWRVGNCEGYVATVEGLEGESFQLTNPHKVTKLP